MMLLPVYVIIEMNHATIAPTEKDIVASASGKVIGSIPNEELQNKNLISKERVSCL
jgi:hypothetical protein